MRGERADGGNPDRGFGADDHQQRRQYVHGGGGRHVYGDDGGLSHPQLGWMGSLPGGVTFTDNGGMGTGTLRGTAAVAGSYALTLRGLNNAGQFQQPFTLDVSPGAFAQLQLLVPGETAAPGTASGVTGTPAPAYVNGPLQVTVNAVDGQHGPW